MKKGKIILVLFIVILFVISCISSKDKKQVASNDIIAPTHITSSNKPLEPVFIPTVQRSDNTEIKKIADYISEPNKPYVVIRLKKGVTFNPETFFEEHKKAFGLARQDKMKLTTSKGERKEGIREIKASYTLKQYHNNIPTNAQYGVFVFKNGLVELTGFLYENIEKKLKTVPTISRERAIELAKKHIPSNEFCWETGSCNQKPHVELSITKSRDGELTLEYFLVIRAKKNEPEYLVKIDAHSGEILMVRTTEVHNCHQGSMKIQTRR